VDADQALDIAKRLQSGDRPQPTRGARLCSFKETSLQLAGFLDERDGAVADGPAGEPTLAGNRLAERRGVSVPGFDPNTPIKPVPPKAPPADAKPATAPKASVDRKPAGDTPPAAPTPADVKSSTGAKPAAPEAAAPTGAKPAADAAPEKAAPSDGAPAQEEKK
jgi:NADH-quinone oxidoreductase subunit E